MCAYTHTHTHTYEIAVLPVIMYTDETLSLTMRKQHRLRLYENKVLKKILGRKKLEATA